MAKAKAKKTAPKKPAASKKKTAKKTPKPAPKKTAKPTAKKTVKPVAKQKVFVKKKTKPAPKKQAKPAAKKPATKKVAAKPVAKKVHKVTVKKATVSAKPKTTITKKAAPKAPVAKSGKKSNAASSRKTPPPKHIPGGSNLVVDHTHESIVRYSDAELLEFKKLIDQKLKDAREELNNLKESLSNFTESQSGNKAWNMEEGTDTSEMEYLMNQISRQNKHIRDLEMALVRIENKTYGICRVTGSLIPKERLRVVPHATLSIEAKNARKPEYGIPPTAEAASNTPDFSESPSAFED